MWVRNGFCGKEGRDRNGCTLAAHFAQLTRMPTHSAPFTPPPGGIYQPLSCTPAMAPLGAPYARHGNIPSAALLCLPPPHNHHGYTRFPRGLCAKATNQPRHPKGTTRAKSGKALAASQSLGRLRPPHNRCSPPPPHTHTHTKTRTLQYSFACSGSTWRSLHAAWQPAFSPSASPHLATHWTPSTTTPPRTVTCMHCAVAQLGEVCVQPGSQLSALLPWPPT